MGAIVFRDFTEKWTTKSKLQRQRMNFTSASYYAKILSNHNTNKKATKKGHT